MSSGFGGWSVPGVGLGVRFCCFDVIVVVYDFYLLVVTLVEVWNLLWFLFSGFVLGCSFAWRDVVVVWVYFVVCSDL